jgi:ATP/maltotriose-dependent transcriptional regulator MalT
MMARKVEDSLEGDPVSVADTEAVFDYFAGEVLRKTDEKTRCFLLRTSFLPEMTAEMAGKVAGEERTAYFVS